MKKTMYIPKGQECRFDDLTCERIVANGSLIVNGKLRTKHISGKGFIYGKWITAKTITADTVDADTIAVDTIIASHVNAFDVRAVQSLAVSTHITANYVKTAHMTYADAEVRELQADEAVKLAPKRRGLPRTLLASYIRMIWSRLTCTDPKPIAAPSALCNHDCENGNSRQHPARSPARENGDSQPQPARSDVNQSGATQLGQEAAAVNPSGLSQCELQEAARLLNDPEFLRLRGMYRLTKQTGDIWQLVQKSGPTDRSVTASTAA